MDPDTSDKLTAQLVRSTDGKTKRMIVYMSGVAGGDWTSIFSPSTGDAVLGNAGWLNPTVSDFIDSRVREWKPTEIMLVGFSAGGQQMQNYAATGANKKLVKDVVLFGAPLTKKTSELKAKSLLIVSFEDALYGVQPRRCDEVLCR